MHSPKEQPHSRVHGQWHWVLWWLSVSDLFISTYMYTNHIYNNELTDVTKNNLKTQNLKKIRYFLGSQPLIYHRLPGHTHELRYSAHIHDFHRWITLKITCTYCTLRHVRGEELCVLLMDKKLHNWILNRLNIYLCVYLTKCTVEQKKMSPSIKMFTDVASCQNQKISLKFHKV